MSSVRDPLQGIKSNTIWGKTFCVSGGLPNSSDLRLLNTSRCSVP